MHNKERRCQLTGRFDPPLRLLAGSAELGWAGLASIPPAGGEYKLSSYPGAGRTRTRAGRATPVQPTCTAACPGNQDLLSKISFQVFRNFVVRLGPGRQAFLLLYKHILSELDPGLAEGDGVESKNKFPRQRQDGRRRVWIVERSRARMF